MATAKAESEVENLLFKIFYKAANVARLLARFICMAATCDAN
jgi:hypothetical protein